MQTLFLRVPPPLYDMAEDYIQFLLSLRENRSL